MRRHRIAVLLLLLFCLAALPFASLQAQALERETIIQQLFTLNRELEENRTSLADLERQLNQVDAQQTEVRARYDQLEAERQVRKEQYAQRLRYYREHGSRAPLLLLFGSKSLTDFLWRLDALEQIMAYDARLARELQELQVATAAEEQSLAAARAEGERLRAEHQVQVAQLEQAIAEQEAILAGLGDDRTAVEVALAEVEEDWSVSAQPVLEALGAALQEMGTDGFEPDDLRVSLFPPGAVVTISEQTLNDYFHRHEELADLVVRLPADGLQLEGTFHDVPVLIEGGFVVLPDGLLRFEPALMQVRDFPVPESVVAEILELGQLDIDVSAVVQPLSLRAVQVTEGVMTIRAGMR